MRRLQSYLPFLFASVLALLLASGTARASHKVYSIDGDAAGQHYACELDGQFDGTRPLIEYAWSVTVEGRQVIKRAALPAKLFKRYEFDLDKQRVHAEFVNPGDPELPPSFTLKVSGTTGRLTTRSHVIEGGSWGGA